MLWLIGLAAAEITLLSNEIGKTDSLSLEKQCEQLLIDDKDLDVRTARFFMLGKGFKYRVVVDGVDTLDHASTIQHKLKGVPLNFVIVVDGNELSQNPSEREMVLDQPVEPKRIVEQIKEVVPTSPKENKKKKRRIIPTTDDVLLHAANAHKIVVNDWEQIKQERFQFYRKRPEEGSLLHHRFYQSDNALRLDITIQKGEGMNSTTVLPDDGEAWVATEEKKVSRNAIRTRELLERFSSVNILSIPYNIAEDIETKEYWTKLTEVESVDDTWRLSGPAATNIIQATFYHQTWLLAGLVIKDVNGTMEYVFRDYRFVQDIGLLPHVIQIFDDEILIEEIQIEELDVSNRLDKSLFDPQ